MKRALRFLEHRNPVSIFAIGLSLVATFGALDYASNPEIALSLFYLIPVALVSWYANLRLGLLVAALAAMVWITAEFGAGLRHAHPYALYWNGFVRLSTFVLVGYLVATLREQLLRAQLLAARDPLTGLYNTRVFYVHVEEEILRSNRYGIPFTLAYATLDKLRTFHNRHGQQAVDELFREMARSMRRHARPVDVLARVGTNEFAILFPESGPAAAAEAMQAIHRAMVETVKRHKAALTVSVGMATYTDMGNSVSTLIRRADDALGKAQKMGKDRIAHLVGGDHAAP